MQNLKPFMRNLHKYLNELEELGMGYMSLEECLRFVEPHNHAFHQTIMDLFGDMVPVNSVLFRIYESAAALDRQIEIEENEVMG